MKVGKTYNYLVFSTNFGNIACEKNFKKEKKVLDTNANIRISSTNFLQITWPDDF
jgi:hypothetical protein